MSEFYKPLDGKKQLQKMMMNDTPTPETDHIEGNLGYAAHPVLLYICRKFESERDKARKELTAANEYADKLAAGLPDGMLPKDVEVLREANLGLAVELTAVTEQRDSLVQVIEAATILIAAKGRHNTMLAYNGLRDALQSLTTTEP